MTGLPCVAGSIKPIKPSKPCKPCKLSTSGVGRPRLGKKKGTRVSGALNGVYKSGLVYS